MLVGVAHDLAALLDDLLGEVRVVLDLGAQVEERGVDAVLVENVEVGLGVLLGRAVVEGEGHELFAIVVGLNLVDAHDGVLGVLDLVAARALARLLAGAHLVLSGLGPLRDVAQVAPLLAAYFELWLLVDHLDVVVLGAVAAILEGELVAVGGVVAGRGVAVELVAGELDHEGIALAVGELVARDRDEVAGIGGDTRLGGHLVDGATHPDLQVLAVHRNGHHAVAPQDDSHDRHERRGHDADDRVAGTTQVGAAAEGLAARAAAHVQAGKAEARLSLAHAETTARTVVLGRGVARARAIA